MKIVEIAPRRKLPIYAALVKREAEIRRNGRGTFSRKGRVRAGAESLPRLRSRCRVRSGMARADGALFRTAETVPAAKPTCSATSRRVTLPGWLRPDFFFFPMSGDYRRRLIIHPRLNSRIAPNKAILSSRAKRGSPIAK